MNTTVKILIDSAPLLGKGALMTMSLWLGASVISLCVGSWFGVVRAKRVRIPILSVVCDGVTFVLRGVPFYVQLLIAYFVVPNLLGIAFSPYVAATCALGLCSAAYVSQIVCGGINALYVEQWQAAFVLGYTKTQTLRFIVLPQVFRAILPALCGEYDQLLKSTSVISSIGVLELTAAARNIVSRTMEPLVIFLSIAVIYLCMSALLNGLQLFLVRRIEQ